MFIVSKPYEYVGKRFGDPFDLQEVANYIAEQIVPGFTGRTWDIRWISVLCKMIHNFNPNKDLKKTYKEFADKKFELNYLKSNLNNKKDYHLPGIKSAETNKWRINKKYTGPYGTYKSFMKNFGLLEQDFVLSENGLKLANIFKNTNINDIKLCGKDLKNKLNKKEKKIFINVFKKSKYFQQLKTTINALKSSDCPLGFWKKTHDEGYLFYCFDQFSKKCLIIFKKSLLKANISNENIKDFCKFKDKLLEIINQKSFFRNFQNLNRLLKVLENKTEEKDIIDTLKEFHVNLSTTSKKWLLKINGKIESFAFKKEIENMKEGYSYRLHNLAFVWCAIYENDYSDKIFQLIEQIEEKGKIEYEG